jgi:YggT family protein
MEFLADLFSYLIYFYTPVVFVYVFLSWIAFSTQNQIVRRIYWILGQIVDPVLQPIRSVLQPLSRNIGIDFSPIVLLILLHVLDRMLQP